VERVRMVFVAALDPEPNQMPAEEDDLGEIELGLVTGWRIKP
jgi:hypothetical protein